MSNEVFLPPGFEAADNGGFIFRSKKTGGLGAGTEEEFPPIEGTETGDTNNYGPDWGVMPGGVPKNSEMPKVRL